jgi:hypothetical protein
MFGLKILLRELVTRYFCFSSRHPNFKDLQRSSQLWQFLWVPNDRATESTLAPKIELVCLVHAHFLSISLDQRQPGLIWLIKLHSGNPLSRNLEIPPFSHQLQAAIYIPMHKGLSATSTQLRTAPQYLHIISIISRNGKFQPLMIYS